ncbi:MAG: hypothetical protein ACYTDY_00765 [Planctomycetota bacterium]
MTRREELFAEYVDALDKAKNAAEEWWKRLVEKEAAQAGDSASALARVRRRWPLGPAAHPYIIATIRKYYLACEALNEELAASNPGGEEEDVYPNLFVSEWLLDEDTEELADFISVLTYWPIGLGSDGSPK